MTITCGGILTAQTYSQTLSTPNYPNPYPNGLECVWIIEAPKGQLITLDVRSTVQNRIYLTHTDYVLTIKFKMQKKSSLTLCKFDYCRFVT